MNKLSKAVPTISVVMVLMLLCAGQATAAFKECFELCALGCFIGKEDKFKCTAGCLAKCIIPNSTPNGLDYCKYGCAVQQCSEFGKDFKKVNDCVNTCATGKCNDMVPAKAPVGI